MDSSLIADNCIQILFKAGMALSLEKMCEVREQIIEAVDKKQFYLFKKNNEPAGFFTWQVRDKEVWINNLFILPEFRGKENLLPLYKFFRSKYPDAKLFYWKNHKRNKIDFCKRGTKLCTI